MVSSDVEYGSLAVTGSGKLTLAGSGRIATSSVTVSSGVALVVNGRLDSTSIAVASGGAVDLVNSRDAHSLSIAGTGINNSGAVYCSESDIVDENNSPFVTNITLAADAMVNADFAWGIIAQNDDKAYLNLGTNKLTIKGTNSFLMARTEVHGSGAIEIADGAALKPVKASPNSIFDATCTIKSGGRLDVAKTATFKDLVCEEGGGISVSPGNNLCIRNQGTMTVRGTVDVRGNLYLGTSYTDTANLEVGGAVNVHNGGELGVSGRGYIKQIPGTQGKVNISNSGRVIYEYCDDPWMAEYGDVFAGTGELAFETEEQITHTITNSDFAGVVKFSSSPYYDACNILGGSEGAMFSGAPELVSGGKIHFGEWYDAEGRVFCVRNLSGSGTFDADREPTETPWTHTIETTQTTNSTFHGKFTGSTCRFDLVVNGAEELHALTLAGENTTSGILTITNNAKVVFSTTGNWTNGMVVVAEGGHLESRNAASVASALQLHAGSTLKIATTKTGNITNAIPVAVGLLQLPDEGNATIDISDIPDLEAGASQTLIACPAVAADADLSHLAVTGKTGCRLKAVAGGIAVELRPDALVWADGSWNVAPDEMSLYGEASIVLSGGTNTVAVPGAVAFDRVSVTATTNATLIVTGAVATVANLILNTNVTFVAPHDWDVDTVLVDAGASISAESDAKVAENLVLVHGSTVYRGAHVVGATWLAVISNAANFEASPSKSPKMLFGSGKVNGVVIRNTTGQQPSGNFQVLNGRWSVTYARPDASVLILEPDAEPGSGAMTITEEGASFSRASWTAPSGEVHSYESAQDAADAAEGKGGKVTVHASGESISLGSGWFASGVSIVVPAGVIGVTVTAAGVVLGGKDSGDGGSREYDEEEEARAEVVENGKKYASLSLAKSNMGNTPCTFRLLAESADSIHLASASDVSGQTLLLNNFPYAGTVTGAAANLARAASVTAYYAILADAKGAWTEGDTINLLSDDARYSVPAGKTLILDGEKTYAVAKPFDLTGTLTVGGCTFTASAGININAGTLKAAKANCTLIGSGTEVTLREGGVRVDTDGYSAVIAATLTVAGGLSNKPVIFKAGLADLRLSGGVSGSSVITIQSGCGKVYAPTSSNCEPGDYTQISEQDAQWATFENGIAVARLVKADGSSTAYSSVNAAGAAAQLNPTYRYIEILVNNQTLRCLPTIGILRIKYNLDDIVLTFSVQSIAPDWTFDETYGVVYSVFTPVHKATDYVWDGGEDGEWESFGNWKCNLALDYDLPVATRAPDGNDTVMFRDDDMPGAGWSVRVGSSGGACKEIKVEEDARLTLSYGSLGCDINKTGAGTIVVTNAWTSGTPTITIEEDGGQVTLPKSAAYTLGTNTVVVSNAEDTVTLGFGVPIADPYAAWAAENGIAGAWNEMDEGGIYNVFRYLFDEPTGDIRIIDISFDAEGNVVIMTPPVKNPEGFAVSVVESSDVAGAAVTRRKPLDATGRTEFSMGSAASRFYRLSATDGDAEPDLGGVQLWENGPYWAECNLGASEPEEHGYYFWWGDTVGYTRSGGTWYSFGFYSSVTWVSSTGEQMSSSPFSPSSCPTYGKVDSELLSAGYIDSTGNLAPEYDAATAHLGAPWRMPTDAEFAALTNNCTATWTTTNGVRGCLVTGKGAYADRSVFLPTAGYGSDSTLGSPNSQGYYWSSTPDPNDSHYAWHLYFNSDNFRQYIFYGRQYGLSVRPVRDAD